ncbi:MAG: HAMP domain-containing histidine kinase [Clostridiales bacterium]|nr:HAMP domain-containing histidine kinase [Clostridiales bacterium]
MAGEIAATDKLKNDFISTVSHELRTPLTSIKGWGETLILDPLTDPELTHRGLQVMINESARLSEIVEELLDFSRMQNGRMVLRLDKIDILAELDEILFVFKERALREGIDIQYNTPDLPAPAFADANRIKQVFVNIMDNAIKYTEEGGRIFVSAEIQEHAIQIIVADNGCGIAEQDLPRVKEKFYKSNISVKGSGIGLAVADEIISLHGGTLDIASVEHEGTTVYIKLPLDTLPPADKERSPGKDE